ncbi:MAG: amidohydrolase family protein [Woeseia sp.]
MPHLRSLMFVSTIGLALLASQAIAQSLPSTWGPQGPPYVPGRPIAIVGGALIDAVSGDVKTGYTVLIEGNVISQVAPGENVKVPKNAEIIDAQGMTVMPGLINANGHINNPPLSVAPATDMTLAEMKARWDAVAEAAPRTAYVSLMQGVTSIRNTGGSLQGVIPLKKKIDAGEAAGPRLFLAGGHFMSPQFFEHMIERDRTPPELVDYVRNEFKFYVLDDLDETLDRALAKDYTYVKLVLSDQQFDGTNDFTDEQLKKIISKAKARGKKVDIHANDTNHGYARLLKFDFDTLEHPFSSKVLLDHDTIAGFAKKGIIVATLYIVRATAANHAEDPNLFNETKYIMSMLPEDYRLLMSYRDKMLYNKRNPTLSGLPIYARNTSVSDAFGQDGPSYERTLQYRETSRENMRHFIRAGVKLAMGTDGTTFLNFQQDDAEATEMRTMVELGMSPMEAIVSSTRNGAEALGMLDKLGTIEAGKLADVIVVAGDPLKDMNAMKRVAYVVKGGVRFK